MALLLAQSLRVVSESGAPGWLLALGAPPRQALTPLLEGHWDLLGGPHKARDPVGWGEGRW